MMRVSQRSSGARVAWKRPALQSESRRPHSAKKTQSDNLSEARAARDSLRTPTCHDQQLFLAAKAKT